MTPSNSALSIALEKASIEEVWNALGGGPLRSKRGRAFWRNGDGLNVSLNHESKTWRDFVSGEGGGILRLIEVATGKSRGEAAEWLIAFAGVSDRPLSKREAMERSERRERAEVEADDLLGWRQRLIDNLASESAKCWARYRAGCALLRASGFSHPFLDMNQVADSTEAAETRGDTCDRLRDWLKAMPKRELASIWRGLSSERRAA